MYLSISKLAKLVFSIVLISMFSMKANAAQYATVVMDARDGRVIYQQNGGKPLHPASLTKMMTLYIAFAELEAGRISLNDMVTISNNAASKEPSKIGLRAGSQMQFKYLLRAAAVKSANDAATAIAEHIGGSESNFGVYMTKTAAALGMKSSRFSNPHGLTANNHYSTAYDMAVLGRHLIYDYPKYFQLFSQKESDTPLGRFSSTNIRFLSDYPGADGIKTGYTRAAGYNLVGSAKRGNERVIVSMFGGQSSYQRNEQVGALLDLGFREAATNVKVANISRPRLSGVKRTQVVQTAPEPEPAKVAPKPVAVASAPAAVAPAAVAVASAPVAAAPATPSFSGSRYAPRSATRPSGRNASGLIQNVPTVTAFNAAVASVSKPVDSVETAAAPAARSTDAPATQTTGDYSIQLEAIGDQSVAEQRLVAASVEDPVNLTGKKTRLLKVSVDGSTMYRPRFSGLSKENAYGACGKIQRQSKECYIIAPSS